MVAVLAASLMCAVIGALAALVVTAVATGALVR